MSSKKPLIVPFSGVMSGQTTPVDGPKLGKPVCAGNLPGLLRGGAHEVVTISNAYDKIRARFFGDMETAGLELVGRRKVSLDAQRTIRYFRGEFGAFLTFDFDTHDEGVFSFFTVW